MAYFNAIEITGDGDRMQTGISQESGGADVTYRLMGVDVNTPPTANKLNEFFDYWNGGVGNLAPALSSYSPGGSTSPFAGKINRVLPPIHPFRPELSGAGVQSCVGVGQHTAGQSIQVLGLPSATTEFPHWTAYDFRVRYEKRPYFLLPDEKIGVYTTPYAKPDGSVYTVYYANEWRRFTVWSSKPLADTATNSYGQSTFKTASQTGVHDRQYDGNSYLFLQNSLIECTWFQVPYRYLLDFDANLTQSGAPVYKSYLTRFVNTVNQFNFRGYGPGRLLYLGCEPVSFIPAAVKRQKFLNAMNVGLDQNLMCNVKLRFLATTREGTDVPDYATDPLFTNKNNIPSGHNLLPNWESGKFYYAVRGLQTDADASRNATFQSFPFELFFTDPLLIQPAGIVS